MTIHIILNSHLDPVWAWRRAQGTDEVIATARTACDIIDCYPEVIITRGEAWFYETLEKCAPHIFDRVVKHIENGRWHVTGGFYIQPDCNLPQYETLLRQGLYAQEYFEKRFGFRVKTGFNVDSFGHAATIPDIWNACGMTNYVMQRPENAVLPLEGNLFEWHGANGGKLNTYRLSRAYCTVGPDLGEGIRLNLEETIKETAPGMEHAMGFIGVGNHGGGPVRKEIEFLLEHPDIIPGWDIKFSTPDEYFNAVENVEKPIWNNELQHHAVGCYSAVRRIKEELRKSENIIMQAENCIKTHPEFADKAETEKLLKIAWKKLFFATFHDVLPGTSVKSAYEDIYDDLGYVRSVSAEIIEPVIRKLNNAIPASEYQQLIFDNLSDADFHGFAECEPWLGYNWTPAHDWHYAFYDEENKLLPSQEIQCECAMTLRRFAVKLDIPSCGRRIITIRRCSAEPQNTTPVKELFFKRCYAAYSDDTDTWSHSVDRYPAAGAEILRKTEEFTANNGANFCDNVTDFKSDSGHLREICRHYDDSNELDIKLTVNWFAQRQVVKMQLTLPFAVEKRFDAVPGAFIRRCLNGKEYPAQGAVALCGKDGKCFVIAGNFSACDVQDDGTLRLTLLRSAVYSHHDPTVVGAHHTYCVSDIGQNEFSFKAAMLDCFDEKKILELRAAATQIPHFSEVTLGCKSKYE